MVTCRDCLESHNLLWLYIWVSGLNTWHCRRIWCNEGGGEYLGSLDRGYTANVFLYGRLFYYIHFFLLCFLFRGTFAQHVRRQPKM